MATQKQAGTSEPAPKPDDAHAVAAAARVNGWTAIEDRETDGGGRYVVYAKDLGKGYKASQPAIVSFNIDQDGRAVKARRDVARRTYGTDSERADDQHGFDFADHVFRG